MLPELDWDEEETQVKDRSDLAPCADLERSGARRTASGVVSVGDLRSTVVMPEPEPAANDAASEKFDARGTIRIDDERERRLRRTTVRATRAQIFGAEPPTWDDEEPDLHVKERFEAIAAQVVARGAQRDGLLDEPRSEPDVAASGERLRRVEAPAAPVSPEAVEAAPPPAPALTHGAFRLPSHPPPPIPPAKKTMIGMPVVEAPNPPRAAELSFRGEVTVQSPRRPALIANEVEPRQQTAQRARIAALVSLVVVVAGAVAAVLL